ncbi:putative MerR family transcriptional regulator [Streptomyces sp. NBRC 110611]|uniref:transcriptional regulator FtsR n=1 Tax=Streptomyces sp. NBRC 110611 TaxID=1621259 RepID=UPI000829B655|nr:MerR family transcriptional regulator [Streptomyces sp. NBRC 110611]GAU70970.1 putative MerR family transcriptional regulator [Streptomyces sp. NBRC 110611]
MCHTPKGGAGAAGAASSGGKPVSIGTVLNALREEFPEVTISKIRFLEAEGLVEPKRTSSGYRKFTPADVERLASVLRMQRDHYLPLKVIREHLDAVERGEQVPLPAPAAPSGELVDAVPGLCEDHPAAARIGRAELLAAAEVDEAALADWESYGLIVPHADGAYDIEAVTVAKLVADLGRFGLEPRHLRVVKAAAEREADLVEQVLAPLRRHRNPQTRAHAEGTAKELGTLTVRLHAALLQGALRGRPQ